MKNFFIPIFIASLLVSCFISSSCSINEVIGNSNDSKLEYSSTSSSNEEIQEIINLTIVELNDVHGYAYESSNSSSYNLASFGYYVDLLQNKEEYDNVITIANGDMFQGTAFSNLSRGLSVINAMNEVGFDMMGIGNHEFDWGLDVILKYFDGDPANGEATFPLINGNVRDSANSHMLIGEDNIEDNIKPYTIVNKGGVNVGLISYIGDQTSSICANKFGSYYIDCYGSEDQNFLNEVRKNAITCKNDGADIIVLNFHEGDSSSVKNLYYNQAFASMKDDEGNYLIDAVINGHTHTKQYGYITRVNGMALPIVQGGCNLNNVGIISLEINGSTKKIEGLSCTSEAISSLVSSSSKKEVVQNVLDYEYSLIEDQIKMKYASASSSASKSQIGLWCANVMKKFSDADVSLINTGGIRSTLDAGDITIESLYEVNPFDNSLIYVEALGSEIISFYNAYPSYYYYNTDLNINDINSSTTYKLLTIDYVYYGSYFQNKFPTAKLIKVNDDLCARDLMGRDLLSKSNGIWNPSDSSASLSSYGWPSS
ncbi:MAG: bifunctional metallophosphatase/5'-nucleotidase [Bacilli bacterium]